MRYSAPPRGRACLRSGCRLRGGEGRVLLRRMRARAPPGDAIVQSSCPCDARERLLGTRGACATCFAVSSAMIRIQLYVRCILSQTSRLCHEGAMLRDDCMQPATSGAAVRVLCYGDSLTAGYTALTKYTGEYAPWATHLGDALGLPVDHVGMCGWTTEQMVDGLDGEANVDVCDVAHRGLRRLLEEGGYTHVRQQWLPVSRAQPAAQSPALLELPGRLHRAALWA